MKKTPEQIAAFFGCTTRQLAQQYQHNANDIAKLAAKCENGKRINGYTMGELKAIQQEAQRNADNASKV